MEALFEGRFDEVAALLEGEPFRSCEQGWALPPSGPWPVSAGRDVLLAGETAMELGHPGTESAAFLMWSGTPGRVQDGRIRLFGPDLDRLGEGRHPFAKITLVQGRGFTEANAYARHLEMDRLRLQLGLKGHMLRAVPQANREWSRVGREALRAGFSLRALGGALIQALRKLDYVEAVEVAFVTVSAEAVRALKPMGDRVAETLRALNRIHEGLEYDCGACAFSEVCAEVEGLRSAHRMAARGPSASPPIS